MELITPEGAAVLARESKAALDVLNEVLKSCAKAAFPHAAERRLNEDNIEEFLEYLEDDWQYEESRVALGKIENVTWKVEPYESHDRFSLVVKMRLPSGGALWARAICDNAFDCIADRLWYFGCEKAPDLIRLTDFEGTWEPKDEA